MTNTIKNAITAMFIAASVALGSIAFAPTAGAVPCRAHPSPWCDPTEQPDDPMKPREAQQGKKSPRSAGNPSR